jgi:predicted enzyme related to lactoylglutathione lyase
VHGERANAKVGPRFAQAALRCETHVFLAVQESDQDVAKEQPMAHGNFCWNELNTRNIERAKKFYADTLGWSYEDMTSDEEVYWLIKVDGEDIGGMFDISDPFYSDLPESWLSYIEVDDVDARVAKAMRAGAKILKPAFDVPGVGRIAILLEPGGATIGWMTPAE